MADPKADDFDPSAYAAKHAPKKDEAFDPSAYAKKYAPAPKREKSSVAETAMRHGAQGVFPWIDEVTASVGAAYQAGKAKLGLRGDVSYGDAFRTTRDAIRTRDAETAEDRPALAAGSSFLGAVATVPALGAMGIMKAAPGAARFIGPVAKQTGGQAASAIARRIGVGAAEGAVSGSGTSEADLTKGGIPEFLADTAKGAAFGLGGSTVGEAIAPTAKGASNLLKSSAERRAFKAAVGNQQAVYDAVNQKGPKAVNEIGRELIDAGVVKFGSKANAISRRADEARKGAWRDMGTILKEVDDTVGPKFDGKNIAAKIRDYIKEIKSPNNKGIVDNLTAQADEYEAMGKISLVEGQRLKNRYKWDPRDPVAMPVGKEAANQIKSIIGDEIDAVVKSAGKADPFGAAKDSYGNMATTAKGAKKLANRQEKNRTISLSDTIFGAAAGGATLNPLIGLAVAGGNKLLRERGSASYAIVADKISDILKNTPKAFGKFEPALQEAAKKGPDALVRTHLLLEEFNPDYASMVSGKKQSTAIERRLSK